MRFGALCLFVGACGFETQVQPSGDFGAPDATKPPDAAPDAPPDAPAKVCAAAYIAVLLIAAVAVFRRRDFK